jgi:hypothetical protein
MFKKKSAVLCQAIAAAAICGALGASPAVAQTAFASSKTIVFPVVANTVTFTSTVTLYNPNNAGVTVSLDYFDANNTAVPGQKPCADLLVPANGSVAFTLASQCTLDPTTSHFGPLIASDVAAASEIFGYSRTQNNAGAGFSIEGFPTENFATDTTNVSGLVGSTNVAPTHQSNCFVTAQADPLTYDMKFFDGNGTQIGSTVSGSLNAFEQIRYLDVFSPAVAAAPAATDFSNVRAEFTRTNDVVAQQMIAFCTVQDNATFGADFRIAKALTPPPPPPPPPPVGELVLSSTWNGAMPSMLVGLPLTFIAAPTPVVLPVDGRISAYGGGWFARNSAGGAGSLALAVCYQNQSGPGPVTTMGSTTTYSVTGSQTWHYAAGEATLAAGTYNVGLCGQNTGSNALNKNGNSTGFVFLGS